MSCKCKFVVQNQLLFYYFSVSVITKPACIHCNTLPSFIMNQNRILGEVSEKIELIVALVFENYKSLDESLPSGMEDVFKPATGVAAPALSPALKLYSLLNDILSPEAQLKLCRYFQVRDFLRTFFFLSRNGRCETVLFFCKLSHFCTLFLGRLLRRKDPEDTWRKQMNLSPTTMTIYWWIPWLAPQLTRRWYHFVRISEMKFVQT